MDNDSLWYSTSITVKFSGKTIDLPAGTTSVSTYDVINPETRDLLVSIKEKYGEFKLEKVFESSFWGDTLGVDINTSKLVRLRDLSQFYKLIFDKIICVDSLINEVKTHSGIASADRPFIAIRSYTPNDYTPSEQWSLDRIGAPRAWNITTGSVQVKIAIVDTFGVTNPTLHIELQGNKVEYNPDDLTRGHGQVVAGTEPQH